MERYLAPINKGTKPNINQKKFFMKSSILARTTIVLLLFVLTAALDPIGQVKLHSKDNIQLVVKGTSTLHDWEMKTSKGECNAVFTLSPSNQLTSLSFLNFAMPANSLKSEHSSMDKNAYKALKTDNNANITYSMSSATIAADGSIKCQGKLSIAGATVDADLIATAKVNADKSVTVTGSKKISMKDFKIDPPTFMMGAVKTGNDITLNFTLILTK